MVPEGVTLNGEAIETLADADAAAQPFGPDVMIYHFDNDATLWVVEHDGWFA